MVKNSKTGRTNGRSAPPSLTTRDEATKSGGGTSNLQRRRKEGERRRARGRRGCRWQNREKSEEFLTVYPRGGIKGNYRVGPVRPVAPRVRENVFQSIRENSQRIRVQPRESGLKSRVSGIWS